MDLPEWSIPILVCLGPAIALFYAVIVWVTYLLAKELQWKSLVGKALVRVGWLVVAFSVRDFVVVAPFLGLVGYSLCLGTRRDDVVGVDEIPYYGENHCKGKVVLVTGANNGIGKETALQLAQMGAQVFLLCRNQGRAEQAMRDILEDGNDIESSQLSFVPLDLGDFDSVRRAVQDIQAVGISRVHVLINNAGLMMSTQISSKDGFEMMMQANHLGHFLLTKLLLEKGILHDNSRILNLTSSTYELTTDGFDFDDMFCSKTRPYTLFGQYSMTKLANLLFSKELSRRYPHLNAFAIHPGIVQTNVTNNFPWWTRQLESAFYWIVASMRKTPAQGAFGSVFVAAVESKRLPPSGSYLVNCKPYPTNVHAGSADDAQRLWEISEKLVGMEPSKENKKKN